MGDFRETLYTVDSKGRRKWVYPAIVPGFFRNRRRIAAAILILIYVLMPWIQIGGMQAVFLDIAHRRFIFFGSTFWATDSRYLFLTLITLGISLFFFTSLFGRIWCGWACPQTVFLEFVFRPIEALIEGKSDHRRRIDQQPMNASKLLRKIVKVATFAAIAWVLANTALAYVIGREPLIQMMAHSPAENLSIFTASVFLMGVLLFQFGWFREQFCSVLCPYARFQSVLLDESSLAVGYDVRRGEPRGKKNAVTGDCIDCNLCVRVCPAGIDIRNGLQLECIQCAACADACDSIMVSIGKPKGLVRYDTELGLNGKRTRWVRPRVVVYAVILFSLISTFSYLLGTRPLHQLSIFHSAKDSLFTTSGEDQITNHLEIHIENKSNARTEYSISTDSDVELIIPTNPFPVAPLSFQSAPVFARFKKETLKGGKRPLSLTISANDGFKTRLDIILLGPG